MTTRRGVPRHGPTGGLSARSAGTSHSPGVPSGRPAKRPPPLPGWYDPPHDPDPPSLDPHPDHPQPIQLPGPEPDPVIGGPRRPKRPKPKVPTPRDPW